MTTVFNDSYNRSDYKKKICDTTSELSVNRSKQCLQKSAFDTDEEFEHMVILGKKGERSKR